MESLRLQATGAAQPTTTAFPGTLPRGARPASSKRRRLLLTSRLGTDLGLARSSSLFPALPYFCLVFVWFLFLFF